MAFNITPASVISGIAQLENLANGGSKVDVVMILTQESSTDTTGTVRVVENQIAADARPMRALVRETAKVMDYPVETGATLSDHKVSNPTEIDMVVIIPGTAYSSAYQQLRTAWRNATLLAIQTRTGTYQNMIIQSMPHEETAEMFSAVTMDIVFREVIYVAPASEAEPQPLANYSPTNPQNSTTVNRGLLSSLTATTGVLSYFRAASVWGK